MVGTWNPLIWVLGSELKPASPLAFLGILLRSVGLEWGVLVVLPPYRPSSPEVQGNSSIHKHLLFRCRGWKPWALGVPGFGFSGSVLLRLEFSNALENVVA